jgi:hypothetical protein
MTAGPDKAALGMRGCQYWLVPEGFGANLRPVEWRQGWTACSLHLEPTLKGPGRARETTDLCRMFVVEWRCMGGSWQPGDLSEKQSQFGCRRFASLSQPHHPMPITRHDAIIRPDIRRVASSNMHLCLLFNRWGVRL